MRWTALVWMLAGQLVGAVHINATTSLLVGAPFNISWTKFQGHNVTIELQWGNRSSQYWTIATVPNTGFASITPQLTFSAEQFRIPNGTAAHWVLESSNRDNVTMNRTYHSNYTCTLLQPMVVSDPTRQVLDVSQKTQVNVSVAFDATLDPDRRFEEGRLSARLVQLTGTANHMMLENVAANLTAEIRTRKSRRRRLVAKGLLAADEAVDDAVKRQVVVTIPKSVPAGGPYLLVLDLDFREKGNYSATTSMTTSMSQAEPFDLMNAFLVYRSQDLSVEFSFCEPNGTTNATGKDITTWDAYEDVCLAVQSGSNLTKADLFVALEEEKSGVKWSIGCSPRKARSFTKFGWKLRSDQGDVVFNVSGMYDVKMFWAPFNHTAFADVATNQYGMMSESFPSLSVNNSNKSADEVVPAVRVEVKGEPVSPSLTLETGQSYDMNFSTAFEVGEPLMVTFVQCVNVVDNCTQVGDAQHFTYNFSEKTVGVSEDLQIGGGHDTTMVVSTPLCDGKTLLNTSFNVSKLEPSPSSSSSSLSAGEIVGIVCAGVLVCGLAAWWLCMRNKGDDRYTKIED